MINIKLKLILSGLLACILSNAWANLHPKSKIAIVSLYDKNFRNIGKYSDWNKKSYAKKHGYDIYLYHETLDADRPVAWSKIPAILNHINDYEWIFWSDADSLIMNDEIKLESFLDQSYDLLIAEHSSPEILKGMLCTGSFFIKNSQWSQNLLKEIYLQETFIDHCNWEQAAFLELLKRKPELNQQIKRLYERSINAHPTIGDIYKKGDFIIHFFNFMLAHPKEMYMKMYYNEALKYELLKSTNISPEQLHKILANLENLEHFFDQYWHEYYHALPKLINTYNLKVGCEVGVAYGVHSEAILLNTNLNKLYSIDPYKHFDDYIDPMNFSQQEFDVLYFKVNRRLSYFDDRSELIRKSSVQACQDFQDGQLDFVFIDARHDYEGVKEDLEAWYDKVRSGGIVSGDDYDVKNSVTGIIEWPGVKQAVDEFFAAKNLTVCHDEQQPRVWWVLKP